jgi:hypothetical protein
MSEFSQMFNAFSKWHAEHPLTSSGISAAIGGIVSLVGSGFVKWWQFGKLRKAWRTALSEELQYLSTVVTDELIPNVLDAGYSLKRLNEDFLENARLQGYTFDKRPEFLKRLAHAYRDVIHTNWLLGHAFENFTKEDFNNTTALSSLHTVHSRLFALKWIVDKELHRVSGKEPAPPILPLPLPNLVAAVQRRKQKYC